MFEGGDKFTVVSGAINSAITMHLSVDIFFVRLQGACCCRDESLSHLNNRIDKLN